MTSHDVLRILARLIAGPWIRLWRGLTTRTRRVAKVICATGALIVLPCGVAWADGSGAGALNWISYRDSHGITLWQYELSVDRGGITSPLKMVWAVFVDLGWAMYQGYVGIACWLLDFTLSFEWLTWLTGPAMTMSDSLQAIVDRFGATTTFLTVAALVAGVWIMRGRWALGLFELFMSCVIASLAVGIFSNPVRLVAGEDGLLPGARDFGLAIASGLANNGDTSESPDQIREDAVGMIIGTFIRQPHQLINFGQRIDGTECEKAYQDALEHGPYGEDSDLRDAVGDCDSEAGDFASSPNASMFLSMIVLMPAGSVIILFTLILSLAVLAAGGAALYCAVRLVIDLLLALLPQARGGLWKTLAELLIAMASIVATVVFLAAWLLVVESLFAQPGNPTKIFLIVDLMMIIGIYLFWKQRARLKAASERLAQAMAKKPQGGRPSQLPGRVQLNAADTYYKGRMALSGAKAIGGGLGAAAGLGASATKALGGAAAAPMGTAMSRIKFAAYAAEHTGDGDRLQERLGNHASTTGQLARVAVPLALAAATGGTSAVVQQAASQTAVTVARRAALQSKMRPAALGPGSSSSPNQPAAPGGGTSPQAPGRPTSPRIQTRPSTAPQVVPGEVLSKDTTTGDDPAARLRARMASRAIPMPGSRAIPMPASRAIPMPPKRPGKE